MALAVLRRYTNLPEAYAAAGALRTAGLHPSVFNWIAGTVLPSSHTERAGYRLGVPEEEAWRAAEILALEHWHEALVFADDEQDWEPPRPRPRWSAWWRLLWVLVTSDQPASGNPLRPCAAQAQACRDRAARGIRAHRRLLLGHRLQFRAAGGPPACGRDTAISPYGSLAELNRLAAQRAAR